MASIKCYLSKKTIEVKRLTQFCLKNGIELTKPYKVKFGEETEKQLSKFISYEVRFYHPKEKRYITKRLGSGIEARRAAKEEKENIEGLIKSNRLEGLQKDYPIEKMFRDYERHSSISHSIKTYQRNLQIIEHFRRFLDNHKPKVTKVMEINVTLIESYRDMRLQDKVIHTDRAPAMKTIRNEVCTLITMLRELETRDKITHYPLEKLSLKKVLPIKNGKKQVIVPSDEMVRRMITEAKNRWQSEWFADCLEFVRYTGARESDLINLQWKDVDLEEGVVLFREKPEVVFYNSRNDRKVVSYRPKSTGDDEVREADLPIHPILKEVLVRIKGEREPDEDDFVFKNSRNVRIPEGALRKMTASTAQRVKPDCGITSFHSLRHHFADKVFAASRGDAHAARLALRHKHLMTSGGYVDHGNLEKVKSVILNLDQKQVGNGLTYSSNGEVAEEESKPEKIEKKDSTEHPSDLTQNRESTHHHANTNARQLIYLAGKNMVSADQNTCPLCQKSWPNKPLTPKCPNCSAILRKDLKIQLLDRRCLFNGCSEEGGQLGLVDEKTRLCASCSQYHDEAMTILTSEELITHLQS